MSLYKHAVERIVQAYDSPSNLPTRMQVAAALCLFHNRLESRELYPRLSARKRMAVKVAVIRMFHTLALETAYETSILAYPLGLKSLFARAIGAAPVTHQESLSSLMAHIQFMAGHPTYIAFQHRANQMADHQPDAHKVNTLAELNEMMSHYKYDKPSFLKLTFRRITGLMTKERLAAETAFDRAAQNYDPQGHDQSLNRYYMPTEGPRSAEELFACLLITYNGITHPRFPNQDDYINMRERMGRLVTCVRALAIDLSDKHLLTLIDEADSAKFSLILKARIVYKMSATIAIGMTRYYIEHHKDKIADHHTQDIIRELKALYRLHREIDARRMEKRGYGLGAKDIDKSIEKMFERIWVPIQIPGIAKLRGEVLQKMDTKKQRRFETILEETSGMFEPVVMFYTEQHEDIRKLRRALFKSAGPREGQDAYKAQFIMKLANEKPQELIDAGLSGAAISMMAESGKIPEDESCRLGSLTVDHIVDLHCGGTNSPENMAIMPTALNKMKNDILLLQTGLYSEDSRRKGIYVIALRPRCDENGNAASILIPRAAEPSAGNLPSPVFVRSGHTTGQAKPLSPHARPH